MLNINTNIIDTRLTINQSTDLYTLTLEYAKCELEVNFRANVEIDFDFNDVKVKSINVERKAMLLSEEGKSTLILNKELDQQLEKYIADMLLDEYLQLTA